MYQFGIESYITPQKYFELFNEISLNGSGARRWEEISRKLTEYEVNQTLFIQAVLRMDSAATT